MDKKGMKLLSALLLAGILGGCGMQQEERTVTPDSNAAEEQAIGGEAEQEESASEKTSETEEESAPEKTSEAEEESVSDKGSASEKEGALSEEELGEYTKWIQGYGVYGFLLSDWSDPAEINLWDVVYSGAGLSETPTEEQIQSYLDLTGQDELYTDFFVISKSGLDQLLTERLGKSYDELTAEGNEGLEDTYDPAHDCYGIQAGDTNYTEFVVETGERLGDGRVLLHYRNSHSWEEYGWIEAGELELLEDGRVLLSNHITEGAVLQ